jgi:hypothetical protein
MKRILSYLKSLFFKKRRDYNDHIDDIIHNTQVTRQRVAIIVGHTNSARGANTYKIPLYGRSMSEYEWNCKRAEEIKFHLHQFSSNVAVKIFKRDGRGIKKTYKAAGKWGATVTVELHLNSMGHDSDYLGAEVLVLKNHYKSMVVAEDFLEEFCQKFSFKNRGVKERGRNDRGFTSVSSSKKYAKAAIGLLLEPTFVGTRTKESARLLEGSGPDDYSRFIAKFLAEL